MDKKSAPDKLPSWAPEESGKWLQMIEKTFPQRDCEVFYRLAGNLSMKDVWAWYESIGDEIPEHWRSATMFCSQILKSMKMPGKPGNMSPKKREAYLKKVRKHAKELAELLYETRYDNDEDIGVVVSEVGELEGELPRRLSDLPPGVLLGNEEWLLAYKISEGAIYRLPWDYPSCHLVEFLNDLIMWTYEPDLWGRGFSSSAPIRHTGEGARSNYLSCILYRGFLRQTGVAIPFDVLANIVNSALDLDFDKLVSAETTRKQVTRYLERVEMRRPFPLGASFPPGETF